MSAKDGHQKAKQIAANPEDAEEYIKMLLTEIEGLRGVLKDISEHHIGDQPASLDIPPEEWAKRNHQFLRIMARDALRA